MKRAKQMTPEERARKRVKDLTGLLWHTAAFVVVNGFLWIQDLVTGGGLEYAYWPTIGWGIGLGFHYAAYFIEERGFQRRAYEKYLAEERQAEPIG